MGSTPTPGVRTWNVLTNEIIYDCGCRQVAPAPTGVLLWRCGQRVNICVRQIIWGADPPPQVLLGRQAPDQSANCQRIQLGNEQQAMNEIEEQQSETMPAPAQGWSFNCPGSPPPASSAAASRAGERQFVSKPEARSEHKEPPSHPPSKK